MADATTNPRFRLRHEPNLRYPDRPFVLWTIHGGFSPITYRLSAADVLAIHHASGALLPVAAPSAVHAAQAGEGVGKELDGVPGAIVPAADAGGA